MTEYACKDVLSGNTGGSFMNATFLERSSRPVEDHYSRGPSHIATQFTLLKRAKASRNTTVMVRNHYER
jgi:hypothetical protein